MEDKQLEKLTKSVAKGGGIVFVGSVIGKLFSFIINIILGRSLGPASYGLYALGISVIGVVSKLAFLGVPNGLLRFGAAFIGDDEKKKFKGLLLSSSAIMLAASLVVATVLFFIARPISLGIFQKPGLTNVIRILALTLPFLVFIQVGSRTAHSRKKMRHKVVIGKVVRPVTRLIFIGVSFLIGFQLYGALIAIVISTAVTATFALYQTWRLFPEILSNLRPEFNVKKLIKYSLPMIFVGLSYYLARRTDRFMLGFLSTSSDVGVYNAAAAMAAQLGFFHSSLVSIFMPLASDLFNKGKHAQLRNTYHLVKRWASYGTMGLLLPVVVYPELFMMIFGSGFKRGWIALIILPLGSLNGSLAGPTGALLQMSGKQNIEFLNGAVMVVLNIGLNYALIPVFGFYGAAIATIVAALTMNTLQIVEIYHIFSFHPFTKRHLTLALVLFIGLAYAVALYFYTLGWMKVLLFVLLIMLLLGLAYKNRTKEDVVILNAIKRRVGIGG